MDPYLIHGQSSKYRDAVLHKLDFHELLLGVSINI